MNFRKYLRTPFLQNTSGRLFLACNRINDLVALVLNKVTRALVVRIMRHFLYKQQQFYKQRQAEIDKYQANAKQDLEAELLLFKNYSHSSSTLSSKNNRTYSEK